MFEIEREFSSIFKLIDDLQRRQSNIVLNGKVAAIDGKKIRLELMPPDARTGKPFLSPWVQLQEAAGITSTNMPVSIGEPMRLLSPNGELSSQSLAIRDSHTTDKPNPANGNEFVLGHDGAVIRMSATAIIIELAGTKIILDGNVIKVESQKLTHNDKDIGHTHTHGGVESGGSDTSVPN